MEPGTRTRRQSDSAALAALFDANVDDLYRYCLARCGSETIADDATSEAFFAAARLFAAGRAAEVDRPWLYVVAKRRLLDQWRAVERERRRTQRLRTLRQDDAEIDLGEPMSERVLRALQSLPRRQRAALALRYLDECSVAEVADALDVNYSAAESLLARGRRGFEVAWAAQTSDESKPEATR